jgi:hypothetical protein
MLNKAKKLTEETGVLNFILNIIVYKNMVFWYGRRVVCYEFIRRFSRIFSPKDTNLPLKKAAATLTETFILTESPPR